MRGACCSVLAGLALTCASLPGRADDAYAFERPGTDMAASVLDAGRIAWEQGLPDVERETGDGIRTHTRTFGSLLRIGLGASLELQLAGEPHVHLATRGPAGRERVSGAGDSSVALKWALPVSGTLEWAVLARQGLSTGSEGLRPTRRARSLGATVAGETTGGRGYALYAEALRDEDGSGLRLSPSLQIVERDGLTGFVEAVAGTGAARGLLAGGGLAWQPRPRFQLDVSLLRGLDTSAAEWRGGVGVSLGLR
ncbi:transporter [Luteimonas deserti]|uniref:Transporter n=1 Tax=Luteimonas deserti TaxID=2752306 RepID=A0A7Z0TX65_9GAMM|nr:transporter [Luteimonas deserti]NYZ64144.1 transporter [Luteimonas deserti]